MGATNYRPAFPSRAFRRLPLLLLATLALLSCDLFDIFPPEIEIVSPKEGTSYFGTLPVEIKATDNRTVTRVEVFLDGTSVHEFTKGPYKTDISLAQVSGKTATLKAVAHDKAGNYDEAGSQVSISLGFKLTSPNGGEVWPEQSTQTITWTISGDVGSSVNIYYSLDAGAYWTEIVNSVPNNGSYLWTLPNVTETETACRVKVVNTNASYSDRSDADFTIEDHITLTSPNGGEEWPNQSTQTVTWTSSENVGTYMSLYYSLNGGDSWTQIVTSTANSGSYAWTLPDVKQDETACRVKVASTSTIYFDASDGDFTITSWEPILIGSYGTPGYAKDVFVSGSYAYVADGGSGLQIINVSNPASPTRVGSCDTPGYAEGVFVSGSYAYVADGYYSGLQIINVANPASPTLAGSCNTPSYPRGVFVSGSYAYVADDLGSSLEIINVSNPASPTLVGSYDGPPGNRAYSVFVSGSYAYVADGGGGLQIINVSNPASPTWVGSYGTPDRAYGVFVSGSYTYVAYGEGGLQIINVSNPASPTWVGSYGTPGRAFGVFVSGSYAYVAGYDGCGLQIINISNPASPTLAGSYDTTDDAFGVFVLGDYAYVADGGSGLLIIDVSGLP